MEKLYQKGGFEATTVSGNADDIRGKTSNKADTSSGDEINQTIEKRKRKERDEESSPADGEDDSHVQKKKRVIWTSEMHQKFVDAIAELGHDRALPKKIIEVMNQPGLTRENVASHLQKYRISLKKSQEVIDSYGSEDHFQQHYLGSSQLASRNYLSISSSSSDLSYYGIGTSIGASRVRLAPPSYSCFDVSSLCITEGNVQNQYNHRTEVNKSFGAYGDEERNRRMSISNRRSNSTTPDDHVTITSTTDRAFMGPRIANDGKSILFGSSDRSEIVTSENYSTKWNEFHCQESSSTLFPSFNVENYVQGSPLPQFPDSNFENHLEEPLLPPLPELYVESSLLHLETAENIDPFSFIPQRETSYGTNLETVDINSFSSGNASTSLEQQNYLQTLPWETLESADMDMISQVRANNQAYNHAVTSPATLTSSWDPNSYTASYDQLNTNLINQEDSLAPLPSDMPLNFYPDASTSNSIPQVMNEQSLLPSLPLESQWNVNSDASTMAGSNNSLDQQSDLLPPLPSEIPWNLDTDLFPQPYDGDLFDRQYFEL